MRIIIIFTLIVSAFAFAAGNPSKRLSPLPKELSGDIIPNFFVLAPDNEAEISRTTLKAEAKKLGAKRIVLSFFATWCMNCKEEFVYLKRDGAKLKEKGVHVYLINVGEKIMQDGQKVNRFVHEFAGDSFPYYYDQNANLLKSFGIMDMSATQVALPMVIVMDADLRVLDVITHAGDDFFQSLTKEVSQ